MGSTKTSSMAANDQTIFITCDDCGCQCRKSAATRIDYICPAPRTAYVCARCDRGETPITKSSSARKSRSWFQAGR